MMISKIPIFVLYQVAFFGLAPFDPVDPLLLAPAFLLAGMVPSGHRISSPLFLLYFAPGCDALQGQIYFYFFHAPSKNFRFLQKEAITCNARILII